MVAVSRTVEEKIWACEMKKILILVLVILCGCARKDPVESIVDNHVSHIDHVLNYAEKNLEQTAGVMLLESELKSCQMALVDASAAYKGVQDKYEAKINYWRLMSGALVFALIVALWGWIKRLFK